MKKHATMLLFVSLLLCSTQMLYAKTPDLKFLSSVDLPNIGLKIKLMKPVTERPVSSPRIHTYTMTWPDGTTKTQDRISPLELFRHSHCAGIWSDTSGNTLTLARILTLFPTNFSGEHVLREEYDAKIEEAQKANPEEWTTDMLAQWVTDFVGNDKTAKAEVISRKPFRLKNLVKIRFKNNPRMIAYAFLLNRSAAGQYRAPEHWLLAYFQIGEKVDFFKAEKTIEKDFINSVTSSSAFAKKKTAGPSKVFQSKAKKKNSTKSPEFLASREQVINSIKNMNDWWFAETENYILLSNLKSRYAVMVKSLQGEIEYLRTAYEKFMPPETDISAVSVIRIFGSSDEYIAYVGENHAWSGGLWMPSKRELIIRSSDWARGKDSQRIIRKVTYHEGFHQYIYFALQQVRLSMWFNEGHAEFFENSKIMNNKLTITEDEYKAEIIKNMSSSDINIEELIKMTREEFYNKNEKERDKNYQLSWALIYYLRKYAPLEKPPRYAEILDKYIYALQETKDYDKATDAAFEGIDMVLFKKDFIEFWKSKNKRGYAKRNLLFQKKR
ncbi:DUF1570 domain-containing protein [Verrucomicrobiota bacterium]